MTEKRQLKRDIERTNVIYDLTKGLSTNELKALTPALLRAAIPMRDALQMVADYGKKYPSNTPFLTEIDKALSLAKEGD